MGTYSGRFNKSLFSVVINYISGKIVSGYDVRKGLRRNLNGEVSQQGNLLNFTLKEAGSNPSDGSFLFTLPIDSLKMTGKWIPHDSTTTTVRKLVLTRNLKEMGFGEEDLWVGQDDSNIVFRPDGTCTFEFYHRPQQMAADTAGNNADSTTAPANPTDQLSSVRGNYEKSGHSYRIEWEKNPYLPVLKMTLVATEGNEGSDSTVYVSPTLTGHGLSFTRLED